MIISWPGVTIPLPYFIQLPTTNTTSGYSLQRHWRPIDEISYYNCIAVLCIYVLDHVFTPDANGLQLTRPIAIFLEVCENSAHYITTQERVADSDLPRVLPVFWTGTFPKTSFLDRQNFLWRIFNFDFWRVITKFLTNHLLGHGWV